MREIITDKFRHDLLPPVHRTTEQKKVQFVSVISVTKPTYFYVIINIFWGVGGGGRRGWGGGKVEEGRGRLQPVIRPCHLPSDMQTRNAKLKLREHSDPT